jgi:hypothetical protein
MLPASINLFLKCLLLPVFLISCTIFLPVQADARRAHGDAVDGRSGDSEAIRSKNSIRQAFKTLMDAMFKYERGLHGDINRLYDLIEVPPGVKEDYRDNYLINAADRLYDNLQHVDFDPEKDIPSGVTEDRAEIQIGRKDGLQVTFEPGDM